MDALDATRHYLNSHNVLCLATTQNAQPWVAPVFYAVHDTGLVFLSAPHTRHCKNIALNPNVSASIQQDYKDWSDIKGIQLEGTVASVPAQNKDSVLKCYADKFQILGDNAPPEIAAALDKISWFELQVSKLYFIDNSRGFGHREEINPSQLFGSASAD